MLFLRDAIENQYVYLEYSLRDQVFGSVHPWGSVDPVASEEFGEWHPLGRATTPLVSCLQHAVAPRVITDVVDDPGASTVVAKCGKLDEPVPAPCQLSAVQRQQIQTSLALPGRYPSASTSFEVACRASTWEVFAERVGTEDFSMLYLHDADGNQYTFLDYGLGDDDWGSVHPRGAVPLVASIDAEAWHRRGGASKALVRCLEEAADPHSRHDAFKRWAQTQYVVMV